MSTSSPHETFFKNLYHGFVTWLLYNTDPNLVGFIFLILQDLIKSMGFEDYSTVLICKTAYFYGFGINLIEDTV